jgi:competence protein ComGC
LGNKSPKREKKEKEGHTSLVEVLIVTLIIVIIVIIIVRGGLSHCSPLVVSGGGVACRSSSQQS